MEHLQLVIGFGTPLFQFPFSCMERFCDRSWLTSMWEFVDSIGLSIHLENPWTLLPQWDGDVFLMEAFCNPHLVLTPKTRKRLNACQIYLQVITLLQIRHGQRRTAFSVNSFASRRRVHRHFEYRQMGKWHSSKQPLHQEWKYFYEPKSKSLCRLNHQARGGQ